MLEVPIEVENSVEYFLSSVSLIFLSPMSIGQLTLSRSPLLKGPARSPNNFKLVSLSTFRARQLLSLELAKLFRYGAGGAAAVGIKYSRMIIISSWPVLS